MRDRSFTRLAHDRPAAANEIFFFPRAPEGHAFLAECHNMTSFNARSNPNNPIPHPRSNPQARSQDAGRPDKPEDLGGSSASLGVMKRFCPSRGDRAHAGHPSSHHNTSKLLVVGNTRHCQLSNVRTYPPYSRTHRFKFGPGGRRREHINRLCPGSKTPPGNVDFPRFADGDCLASCAAPEPWCPVRDG